MISIVAALKAHAILVLDGFQSGETSSIPGGLYSFCSRRLLRTMAFGLHTKDSMYRKAQPAKNSVSRTDKKPTPISVGLMGQVALCRPCPPSSHIGVVERPGWQPRGLPDLSNFD